MAGQVFISHSSRDSPWVEWVAAQARALGLEPYLAEHDPQPGRLLSAKIEAALRSSDVVIVLYTRNSIDSVYVNQEIGFARGIGKLIVPLVHPDVAHRSRAMLDGIEFIVFDFDNPSRGAADLIGELQRIASELQQRELLEAQRRQLMQAVLVAGVVLALVVLAQQGPGTGAA